MADGIPLIGRRSFLTSAIALAATARPRSSQGGTKLILLGTGGGPRPRKASSAAAQVIVANNAAYVIDCGDGVARQLAFAGVPLTALRHVFITHQHSDHNADYGNLIWLAWIAGLNTRVDTWGPPPLERMTRLFFEMNASDIDVRVANEGRTPLAPLVRVHELSDGGAVMADDNVKVTSTLVDHPPVVPAFALPVRRARSLNRDLRRHRTVAEPGEARRRRGRAGALRDVSAGHRSARRTGSQRRGAESEHPRAPDVGGGCRPAGWPRRLASGCWSCPTSCRPTIPRSPTRCGSKPRGGGIGARDRGSRSPRSLTTRQRTTFAGSGHDDRQRPKSAADHLL
jgi:hypothetical protein